MVTLLIAITILIAILFALLLLRGQIRNAKINDFNVDSKSGNQDRDGITVEKGTEDRKTT